MPPIVTVPVNVDAVGCFAVAEFISDALTVTPSIMFNSAAVAVTATPPICKAVEALIVGPVTVPVNVGLATGALVSSVFAH